MKPQDIKRCREELGLTQQQLAEALHTTRVSVARYEAGMRKIPGVVSVVLDQLRRKTEIPMAASWRPAPQLTRFRNRNSWMSPRACCVEERPSPSRSRENP
ncbi:MAG: helix-turn-helix transcriptional regulator [Nitrospira sp.]|nr:helix-turn-helix transcriptional regulator [Nitrospira sp.]